MLPASHPHHPPSLRPVRVCVYVCARACVRALTAFPGSPTLALTRPLTLEQCVRAHAFFRGVWSSIVSPAKWGGPSQWGALLIATWGGEEGGEQRVVEVVKEVPVQIVKEKTVQVQVPVHREGPGPAAASDSER